MDMLIKMLIEGGGKIISSNDCTRSEIAQAAACNRMHIDENGFGFIYLPKQESIASGRRNRLDLMFPSEISIYNSMQEIERLPPNVKLTEAVILLSKAKDLVSDFFDEKGNVPDTPPPNPEYFNRDL